MQSAVLDHIQLRLMDDNLLSIIGYHFPPFKDRSYNKSNIYTTSFIVGDYVVSYINPPSSLTHPPPPKRKKTKKKYLPFAVVTIIEESLYKNLILSTLLGGPSPNKIANRVVRGIIKMNLNNVNVPKMPGGGPASALIKLGLVAGLGVYGVANSLYNVDGGHRAIVFNRIVGVKDKVYPEGTHFIIPWFERPVIYDVRARPHLVESTSGSRDLQMVKIGLRVLTRPVADQLPTVYRALGENYNERVLPSIIHETLKAVVAQYNASQLITQRENVSREIRKILTERAANFNIALDDVSITSLTFGREFTAAIEAKQVAAQEAERAKFVVEKAEQDKRSAIIRAQGEAKSAQLIGEAIANNAAFITLRRIEAAREIAQTLSHANNKVYLSSDDLLLNLQDLNLDSTRKR